MSDASSQLLCSSCTITVDDYLDDIDGCLLYLIKRPLMVLGQVVKVFCEAFFALSIIRTDRDFDPVVAELRHLVQ
jgi:hypothetical protein